MIRGICMSLALGLAVWFGGVGAAADEPTVQRAEDLFSGAELLSGDRLVGTSATGAAAQESPVPAGAASANAGCMSGESCNGKAESNFAPSAQGGVISESFNRTIHVSAINVFTASFGSGTIVLGNAAADAASAAAAR